VALSALVCIWAFNFSAAKFALGDFAPLAFNGIRFILASAFIFVFMKLSGQTKLILERRYWPVLIGLGILGHVVYQVMFIFGLDLTRAGNASLMLAMSPVFITLISVAARQERVGWVAWAGVVVSFAGVALVVRGGAQAFAFGADTVRGDLLVLAAAAGWSAYTVGSAPLVRRYGALPVTAATLWVGSLGLVLVSIPSLISQPWSAVSPVAWAAVIYSGIFAIGAAYLLWYYCVRRLGSTRTGVYSNAIPIVALLIAWLTLGEVPTWLQGLGAAGIVCGAVLARLGKIEGVPDRLPPE
jgi:drug/metabolite transporter (DMT)-like permease